MKISVEVELSEHEFPLATELLSALRCALAPDKREGFCPSPRSLARCAARYDALCLPAARYARLHCRIACARGANARARGGAR
jgi:hypothetical protein